MYRVWHMGYNPGFYVNIRHMYRVYKCKHTSKLYRSYPWNPTPELLPRCDKKVVEHVLFFIINWGLCHNNLSKYRKMMMMTMVAMMMAMMMMVVMMIWKSLIQGLRAIKCGQNLPSLFWYNDTAKTSQVQLDLKGQLLKIKIKICDLRMLIEK